MNKYLTRSYFSNDDQGFYKYNIFLRCTEQVMYQTLRDYNVDYKQIMCDDINMIFYDNIDRKDVFVNDIEFKKSIFEYKCIVKDNVNQNDIEILLSENRLVIFQTAINRIKMYKWYGSEDNNFEISQHKAIILGQDDYNFFVLDSPFARNEEFFVKHQNNDQVGIVAKKEFMEAAKVRCEIGYMQINEHELESFSSIHEIISTIINNYYTENAEYQNGRIVYLGRIAIIKLIEAISYKRDIWSFYNIPYICELFISRFRRLKVYLENYWEVNDVIYQIDRIIGIWDIIKLLIIKQTFSRSEKIYKSINIQLNIMLEECDLLMILFRDMLKAYKPK